MKKYHVEVLQRKLNSTKFKRVSIEIFNKRVASNIVKVIRMLDDAGWTIRSKGRLVTSVVVVE